jgi:hypothetical protein
VPGEANLRLRVTPHWRNEQGTLGDEHLFPVQAIFRQPNVMSVRDDGGGIPTDKLKCVFDLFGLKVDKQSWAG